MNTSAEYKSKISPFCIVKPVGEAAALLAPRLSGGWSPLVCQGAGRAMGSEPAPTLHVRPFVPTSSKVSAAAENPTDCFTLDTNPTLPMPCEHSQDLPRTTVLAGPPEAQPWLCPIFVDTSPRVPLKSALGPQEKRSCPLHNLVMLAAQPLNRGTFRCPQSTQQSRV